MGWWSGWYLTWYEIHDHNFSRKCVKKIAIGVAGQKSLPCHALKSEFNAVSFQPFRLIFTNFLTCYRTATKSRLDVQPPLYDLEKKTKSMDSSFPRSSENESETRCRGTGTARRVSYFEHSMLLIGFFFSEKFRNYFQVSTRKKWKSFLLCVKSWHDFYSILTHRNKPVIFFTFIDSKF